MAEAFARIHGKDCLEAYSAGSRPSGRVNEKAVLSMQAVGYDLTQHVAKSLDELPEIRYDFAVTMGCGDTCPHIDAVQRQDWSIPDLKDMEMPQFDGVRNMIEAGVLLLLEEINCSE